MGDSKNQIQLKMGQKEYKKRLRKASKSIRYVKKINRWIKETWRILILLREYERWNQRSLERFKEYTTKGVEVNDAESVNMEKKKKIDAGFETIQEGKCWIPRFKKSEALSTDLNEEPQGSWEEVKRWAK